MASREDKVATYLARVAAEKPGKLNRLIRPRPTAGEESVESPEVQARVDSAREGLREIERGRTPTPEQTASLEAIILPDIRPVLDVVDGLFSTDHPLWEKLNEDGPMRSHLLRAVRSVGRIELPGHSSLPYGGTGFVVGPGLVMTNRHVAAIFASGVGTRAVFKPGRKAGIDFLRELERPTGPVFNVTRIVMVHPYWDMALLAVNDLPDSASPLSLSLDDPLIADSVEVAAIGYPAFDDRNNTDVQNDLFRRVFGVKRLQPGTLGARRETESFGKMVSALMHNCSTLGGNSGSALVNLNTGAVMALHFGGRYGITNYGVPTKELGRDNRVIDAGVAFASPPTREDPWAKWWNWAAETPSVPDAGTSRSNGAPARVIGKGTGSGTTSVNSAQLLAEGGSVHLVVPLHVTLRLGAADEDARATAATAGESSEDTEKLAIPWHDDDYSSRTGYDASFLGVSVPRPRPTDESIIATALDGSTVLHYQNFSIIMHAKRRMALITASNVTAEPDLKKPEPNRVYTRKALSGLGKNDQERWFPDTRLHADHQLPDVFYTRDDGAFDKGHVVRREDVAWGRDYATLRRANGDTYHVTNCSPQVAGFNRGTLGEDNWGDLEDHVLKGASKERYCQFAGPVLDPDDEVFVGAGGGRVRLRVKIPSRYWKVIVVATETGIASYGFVLEQDLSDVPFEEFIVPEAFARFMTPLTDIQQMAGVTFADVVLDADQFGTNEGLELAMRSGVTRRSRAGVESVLVQAG